MLAVLKRPRSNRLKKIECALNRVIFCSVCNLVANATTVTTQVLNVIDTIGNPALLCVLGNHLLIHLKETADKGLQIGTSYTLKEKTLSAIDFQVGGQPPLSLDEPHNSSVP